MLKLLNRFDFTLIILLLFISFIPLILLNTQDNQSKTAIITIDRQIIKEINLSAHQGYEEIDIDNEYGHNIIVIDGETIAITDADCADKVCVHTGKISKAGETIACLPHHLLIEIKGVKNDDDIIPLR